jgi:hypothetical protein
MSRAIDVVPRLTESVVRVDRPCTRQSRRRVDCRSATIKNDKSRKNACESFSRRLFASRVVRRKDGQNTSAWNLLKLRHDVDNVLARRSKELRDQLTRLGGETSRAKGGRGGALRGRKVPVKFRDRSGNTWAGRGAMPVWLRAKIKAGAKLQDFAVDKKAAPRKGRKQRRGRRAKR